MFDALLVAATALLIQHGVVLVYIVIPAAILLAFSGLAFALHLFEPRR